MLNVTNEKEEVEWFERVSSIIKAQLAVLSEKGVRESEDSGAFRKFMWEFAGDIDRVEKIVLGDIADQDERKLYNTGMMLHRLRKLESSPYFGRIDFHENEAEGTAKVYVGTHALFDSHLNSIIHDWRAPICSLFYDYELGPASYTAPEGVISGEIHLKRQYSIEDGKMKYILDGGLTITDEVLREALARNTTGRMREIAKTIQKEQNAVIRNEQHKVLVVEGAAGSGKTSVALHRAAYLLYRYRNRMTYKNLMIFSPNDIFSDYISNVLPELGEQNIMNTTFDECAKAILGNRPRFEDRYDQLETLCTSAKDSSYERRSRSIMFKSSLLFLEIMRNYAEYLRKTVIVFSSLTYGGSVVIPESHIRKLYKEHCAWMPIIPSLEHLVEILDTKFSDLAGPKLVRHHVASMLQKANIRKLYADLFADPNLIKRLAEGQDVPDDLDAICALTHKSALKGKVLYEDIAPILLLKGLFDGFMADKSVIHLIIDEAQDYTPIQYEIIRHVFSESSITLLGDINQSINPFMNIRNFDSIWKIFSRNTGIIVPLMTSYRATFEIAQFTSHILKSSQPINVVARNGEKPTVTCVRDSEKLIGKISADIDILKKSGLNSIAVICKSAKEAKNAFNALKSLHEICLVERDDTKFEHGIVVIPVYLAKGLEFDGVIIYDAGSHNYSGEDDRRLFYTACTRALHVLHVYFTGDISDLIPSSDTKLYSYINTSG